MNLIGNAEPVDWNGGSDEDDSSSSISDTLQTCLTGKVWVTVTCSEVFYIEDKASGAVVQGSKEVKEDVVHEMLLECCLQTTSRTFVSDWKVIDIDHWLQGNEFIKNRAVKAVDE